MLLKMFVKANLQVKLFLRQTAMAYCKILVDEFDCEDWFGGMEWCCFLDAESDVLVQYSEYSGSAVPTNHAYAPDPIVLETIRNGSSLGSGANCE